MAPAPKRKSGQIVVPGDRLGVIEEFTPGPGTYEEEGAIYSLTTGRALLDLLNKKVSVYPRTSVASVPHVGSLIVGQVSDVQSKTATIRIFQIGKRLLSGFFSGVLHVSDVSPRYVESMHEVCKSGDILRGKVVSDKNRTFHLSTNERNLGVLHAFCSNCGHQLSQRRFQMRCPECGRVEKRKAAQDYGKEEL